MAAPVRTDIRLPDDSGNLGKRVQTQSEVIGGNTVHAHYFITRSQRKIVGKYTFVTPLQTVLATAHTVNTQGFWWLQIPAGSTIRARIRKMEVTFTHVATETDHLTAPRIVLARFTFTGTASGATITPSKIINTAPTGDSADAAAVTQLRSAITGMTCTYESGYTWGSFAPPLLLTTSGLTHPYSLAELKPNDELEFPEIGAGEGFVLWQPDNGTASDGRRFNCFGMWDEYDNA